MLSGVYPLTHVHSTNFWLPSWISSKVAWFNSPTQMCIRDSKKYSYWDDPDNAEEAVKVPVNARHVKHMILAGCFDRIEKSRGGYRTLRAARTRSTGTGILPF